jgi:hypothetical protein
MAGHQGTQTADDVLMVIGGPGDDATDLIGPKPPGGASTLPARP